MMTIRELPMVDPLMVRRFTPTGYRELVGGVLVMDSFDVADDGPVTARLSYDEDVVDCSQRIFQITNAMIMSPKELLALAVFPSRRWRNLRTGQQIEYMPDAEHPLRYLGNPIPLFKDDHGIQVMRLPEFLIKTGRELGY